MPCHRRRFLHLAAQTALGGSALFGLIPAAPAADDAWEELGAGLFLVRGGGGAVLVSQGSDGVALVDGGSSEHPAIRR